MEWDSNTKMKNKNLSLCSGLKIDTLKKMISGPTVKQGLHYLESLIPNRYQSKFNHLTIRIKNKDNLYLSNKIELKKLNKLPAVIKERLTEQKKKFTKGFVKISAEYR
jgi:flagellar biosynthesis chaperone FliJ